VVTVAGVLADTGLFGGLTAGQLRIVAGCGSFVRFPAGAEIFRQGQTAEHFYVLRSGRVSLSAHAPGRGAIVVQTLGPGDTLGWSWLFEPHRYQFDGAAGYPVAAIAFDGECLRRKCEDDHELGYQLMSRFARLMHRALDETRVQLVDVYGP
jgi:CRP-like cAMP-binding protein